MASIAALSGYRGQLPPIDRNFCRPHTDFQRMADGAMPAAGDDLVPFTINKTDADISNGTITGGKLTFANLGSAGSEGAVYVNQNAGAKIQRIGAVIEFSNQNAGSAVALCTFDQLTMSNMATLGAHIHWSIGPTNWTIGVLVNGVVQNLTGGNVNQTLPANSPIVAEAYAVGDTVILYLDGMRYIYKDSRIATLSGHVACAEPYRTTTTQAIPYIREFWADIQDPVFVAGVRSQTQASAATIDGTIYGDEKVICTGNVTITPSTSPVPADGTKKLIEVVASGAARTPTLATAVVIPSGGSRSIVLASGGVGYYLIRYSAAKSAWVMMSKWGPE